MKLVTLLMRIPLIITWLMAISNFVMIFSNKISLEKFFKVRMVLSIGRWITNLIAILGIFYFELYELSMFMGCLMLFGAIEDIILLSFLKKVISKNKRK